MTCEIITRENKDCHESFSLLYKISFKWMTIFHLVSVVWLGQVIIQFFKIYPILLNIMVNNACVRQYGFFSGLNVMTSKHYTNHHKFTSKFRLKSQYPYIVEIVNVTIGEHINIMVYNLLYKLSHVYI